MVQSLNPAPLLHISPARLELTRRQAAAAIELLIAARYVLDHPHSTKALRLLRKKCVDLLPVFPEESAPEPPHAIRCNDCGVTSLDSYEQHAATCERVREWVSVSG